MKTAPQPQETSKNIEALFQENLSLTNEIQVLAKEKQKLASELKFMTDMVAYLRNHKFGRKTEKDFPEQGCLFDEPHEDEKNNIAETEQEQMTVSYTRPKSNKRKPLPEDLLRERVVHDLKEEEKICGCGHELHKIGEDISEQLDIIPAQMKVIQNVRPKYGCRACEEGVKTAPMPKQPIPKSIASPGLLAYILVSKYCDHLPLYRQESIFKRIGIDMPRSTACEWTLRCGELLLPLVTLLKEKILSQDYVQVDETPVKTLKQDTKENRTNTYIWVIRTGPPQGIQAIVYEYHPTRSGSVAQGLFADFKGFLQSDGYSGYSPVHSDPNITALGCMAHARRKFVDIVKISKKSGAAQEAVSFIAKLYAIESEARKKKLPPDQIYELRKEKSKPILDKFKSWLIKTKDRTLPRSTMGGAVGYALNQWESLITYLQDGRLQIDNNSIERTIKPFKLGSKNWLFLGNRRGAEAAAAIYSLIETCKANDIEPYAYLRHTLTEIPKAQTRDDLLALLP